MNLQAKLFLPVFMLFVAIAATLHFYWLPNYLLLETEEQIKSERSYVELLGTTLEPDILVNDLAKIYTTLERVREHREYWYAIELYNKDNSLIYPLAEEGRPKNIDLEQIEYEFVSGESLIAVIRIWIDIDASSAQRVAHIDHLEELLLITLLIVALFTGLLQERWIKSPLRELAHYAGEISQGQYDSSMNYRSNDEVGKLVNVFNGMGQKIRQREADLLESQERNKAVIDNAVDGIISISPQGKVISFNPASETIFGYQKDEVIGQNINMLMPQPYRREHDGYLYNYLSTGEKKVIGVGREVEGQRKDGKTFPLELAVSEVNLAEKRLFIGIVRDISERKYTEQQAARYADALERLHVITSDIEIAFEQKVQRVLELGLGLFEMRLGIVSQIDGERYIVQHIVGPEGAPTPGTEFRLGETYCCHTLAAKGATGFEYAGKSEISDHPCYKKCGLESYIGTPITVNGKLYGTLNFSSADPHDEDFSAGDYNLIQLFAQWVGNEITRVQAEKELFNTTALRQAILDSANFSVIATNVDGTIRIFNKGAERMLGYPSGDMIDLETPAILHDEGEVLKRAEELSRELGRQIEPGFDVFVTLARSGIPDEREWTYIRKDGTRFPVLLSVTSIRDEEGEITGFLGIGSDLTERKKVDQMKSEFVSTVSHELRTPLTSIRGALSLVLGKGGKDLPPKLLRMLETANRNSERLTFLINDILDLEKINAGKLDFLLEEKNLYALVKRAMDENHGYAHSHDVTLALSFEVDEETTIRVDEHRLLQVFANLISNAVKFSPKGDAVNIRVSHTNERIRVSVIDNGAGISEGFRSRIFGRFAQADSSDTREKGGTGLGLTITKAIVEQLGGYIDFNSKPGEGAEFFFELPIWEKSVESSNADTMLPKVLVCEDDHDVAYVLANLLEEEGLSGDIASTAEGAKELLGKNDYRLLLLDLNLPDSNGLDLVRELREKEITRDLPIIVVSGQANEGRKEFNGDAFTVADWLQKPIDRQRLSRAVADVVRENHRPRILHVEDNLDVIQVTQALFEDDADFEYATSLREAKARLDSEIYDLVVIDISLPDGSGLELLERIGNKCPIVLFSGQETSVEINEKVAATLTKSRTSNEELIRTVKRLLK